MTETVSYTQIQGSLGSLLLLWSSVEHAAREEVVRLRQEKLPKSAHGIAAVLNTWEAAIISAQEAPRLRALLASRLRAQLQEPLNVRNGLCHGLRSVSAAHRDGPATLTWELNGEERSITWDELQVTFRWLSKVPFAISSISRWSSETHGSRIIDNQENRDWWMLEYGIALSSNPKLSL